MKKWIVLVILALLAGTAFFLYSKYRDAASMKEFEGHGDLTDRGIREGIRSTDPTLRLAAAEQIGKLSEAAREKALVDALAADYAPTRLTALSVIGKGPVPGKDLVTSLLDLAREDPDVDVRDAAFRALRRSGDPRVLDLAMKTLESLDAPLAQKVLAARTLDALTGRETVSPLAGKVEEAGDAADDLAMEWDEWLGENRERLRWDPEAGVFR